MVGKRGIEPLVLEILSFLRLPVPPQPDKISMKIYGHFPNYFREARVMGKSILLSRASRRIALNSVAVYATWQRTCLDAKMEGPAGIEPASSG